MSVCSVLSRANTISSLILFICWEHGFARSERRFICQHPSGHGKCFEVYYRSFRAASEGFHFYCLEAGGGIIAPHCTGGSRGWRLAAAERGPIDYWPAIGTKQNNIWCTCDDFPLWSTTCNCNSKHIGILSQEMERMITKMKHTEGK